MLIVFYSMYGRTYQMARAEAEGVLEVEGADLRLRRVRETVPEDILRQTGAYEAQEACRDIPECAQDDMMWADGIIFGTPVRFGNMAGQMRDYLDTTGGIWARSALVGKVGGVFVTGATQHGGQETTAMTFITNLMHYGMVVAGLPYLFEGQLKEDEVTGGSPYGAGAVTGQDMKKMPSENELAGARFQGRWIAELTRALAAHRPRLIEELKEQPV